MKTKIISVILSALMLLCLAGCDKTEPVTEEESLPALVIGSDLYKPYFFVGEDGSYAGIDVEIAREACRRIGLEPVFSKIDWDVKDEILGKGDVDCLWGCFTMTGREDEYLWAGPYLYTRQMVLVKSAGEINKLSDLDGKTVAVQVSGKAEWIFLDRSNLKIPRVSEVLSFLTMEEAVTALCGGKADAAAGHEAALEEYTDNEPGVYRLLEQPILEAQLGIAFEKGSSSDIPARLSAALEEMKLDGTLSEIVEKYGLNAEKVVWGDMNVEDEE